MRRGVWDSGVFYLALTENVLMSWFCRQEMRCAIELGRPVQLVLEEEPRFAPFDLVAWAEFSAAMERTEGTNLETVTEQVGDELQVTEVCLVPDSPFDRLPAPIWRMVRDNLPEAVTYRRRDFEHREKRPTKALRSFSVDWSPC